MILDTSCIKEGHSVIQELSGLEAVKDDLPPINKKVACTVTIDRSSATLYIQVQFEGLLILECARCLSTYNHQIMGDFRVILQEREGSFGPAKENEPVDYYFDSRHQQVDLSPLIYDEIMISLPLKPLCADTCKGIEISQKPMEQHQKQCDPRWNALKELKNSK